MGEACVCNPPELEIESPSHVIPCSMVLAPSVLSDKITLLFSGYEIYPRLSYLILLSFRCLEMPLMLASVWSGSHAANAQTCSYVVGLLKPLVHVRLLGLQIGSCHWTG
jgi:hypothetical protein